MDAHPSAIEAAKTDRRESCSSAPPAVFRVSLQSGRGTL